MRVAASGIDSEVTADGGNLISVKISSVARYRLINSYKAVTQSIFIRFIGAAEKCAEKYVTCYL